MLCFAFFYVQEVIKEYFCILTTMKELKRRNGRDMTTEMNRPWLSKY